MLSKKWINRGVAKAIP